MSDPNWVLNCEEREELARSNARLAERERDEALAERQEIAKVADKRLRDWLTACEEKGHMEAERDAARAQVAALQDELRKLATYAKPVVDRLWESGESQPAEVIRLGEATQEALVLVKENEIVTR